MNYSTKSKLWFTLAYVFATIGLISYLIYAVSVSISSSAADLAMNILFFVLFIGSMGYLITGLVRRNNFQVYRSSSYIILVITLNAIFSFIMSVAASGFEIMLLFPLMVVPIVGGALAYFGLRKSLSQIYSIPWMFYIGMGILILCFGIESISGLYASITLAANTIIDTSSLATLLLYFSEPIGLLFFSLGILASFVYFRKYR